MRSDIEFKREVLERLEKQIIKRKKSNRRLLAIALPLLLSASVVTALFTLRPPHKNGIELDKIDREILDTETADAGTTNGASAAAGDGNDTVGTAEDGAPNDNADLGTDNTTAPFEPADSSDNMGIYGLQRTYHKAETIADFKALFSDVKRIKIVKDDPHTDSMVTGAYIVITDAEHKAVEKYILNPDGLYKTDMTEYYPLDEKSFEALRRFVIKNEGE